jgi:hypothetical protein
MYFLLDHFPNNLAIIMAWSGMVLVVYMLRRSSECEDVVTICQPL